MFGINLLNPFAIGDTIHTTTIVWLRILLFIIIVVCAYFSLTMSKEGNGKYIQYGLYFIIALCVFIMVWYLNTGSVLPGLGGNCVYCPAIGSDIKNIQSGVPTVVQTSISDKSPFMSSHIYYFVIQDTYGRDIGSSSQDEMGRSLIHWDKYYRIGLDRTTGTLYFRTGKQSPKKATVIGKIPYNTLVQLAVIQNQKAFAVCMNGERKITIQSPSLPPSTVLTRTPVINSDGIISKGILYHTEVHGTILDTPDLMRHREAVAAVYANSTIFQQTAFPSSNPQQSTLEKINGYVQLIMNRFSYSTVLNNGINSLQEQNGHE